MAVRRHLASRVYYGWVVAGACLLASVALYGTSYAFGVFSDRFVADFAASPSRVSLVFGVQTFVLYVGAVAAGRFVDRRGPRLGLVVGAVLLAVGLSAAGLAGSIPALVVAYGVVAGLGLSFVYVVAYATVPQWFGRRRGTANGIATAGLGIGLLVVPPAAAWLVSSVGWRDALLAIGLVAGGYLLLVSRLFATSHREVGADPGVEFGDRVENGGSGSGGSGPSDDPAVDDGAGSTGEPGDRDSGAFFEGGGRPLRETLLAPAFLLVFLGWVLVYGSLYVLYSHVVLFAIDIGIGKAAGVTAIAVVGGTTTVARLGLGRLSDRVGRVRVFVASSTLMGLATLALPSVETRLLLWVVAGVYGVGYGGNGALLSPLVADLFGEADINTVYGAMSLALAVSGLAAPPLAGLGFEHLGSYGPVWAAFGVLALAGAVCIALAGRARGELGR